MPAVLMTLGRHVVYQDGPNLFVEWDNGDGFTRIPVVICDLCDGPDYKHDTLELHDAYICQRCADWIMNVQHNERIGGYVTWENRRPPQKPNKRRKITAGLRREVYERDMYACRYCGARQNLGLDHITPVTQGGTNEVDNLVTCCHECNARKNARTPDEAGMTLLPPPKRVAA